MSDVPLLSGTSGLSLIPLSPLSFCFLNGLFFQSYCSAKGPFAISPEKYQYCLCGKIGCFVCLFVFCIALGNWMIDGRWHVLLTCISINIVSVSSFFFFFLSSLFIYYFCQSGIDKSDDTNRS